MNSEDSFETVLLPLIDGLSVLLLVILTAYVFQVQETDDGNAFLRIRFEDGAPPIKIGYDETVRQRILVDQQNTGQIQLSLDSSDPKINRFVEIQNQMLIITPKEEHEGTYLNTRVLAVDLDNRSTSDELYFSFEVTEDEQHKPPCLDNQEVLRFVFKTDGSYVVSSLLNRPVTLAPDVTVNPGQQLPFRSNQQFRVFLRSISYTRNTNNCFYRAQVTFEPGVGPDNFEKRKKDMLLHFYVYYN